MANFRHNNGYDPYRKLRQREREEQMDAKEAMLEYNKEKSQAIDRTITTHEGLPSYTDAQLTLLSGEVRSYKINEPLDVGEFNSFDDESKIRYLQLLEGYYNSLSVRNTAEALHISGGDMSRWFTRAGLKRIARGQKPNFEDNKRFKDDMGIRYHKPKHSTNKPAPQVAAPVEDEVKAVAVKTEEPTPQEEKKESTVNLSYIVLDCDAPDLLLALSTLPLRGRYRVTITNSLGNQEDE